MDDFETLRRAIESGRIRLGVHIRKMNSPGSPVYRYGENLWMPVLILVVTLAVARLFNVHVGAAVLAAGMGWWLWKVQPKVKDGVYARTSALALQDVRNFDALWMKGALTLHAPGADGRELLANRKDDWRRFVHAVIEGEGWGQKPSE